MEEQLSDPGNGGACDDVASLLASALTGMEATRHAVERKLEELKAIPLAEVKAADLAGLQRELAKAMTSVVHEEGKVKDALRQQTGGGGIDFDAARAAIRGRLDSIRAGSDPGGVSDGVE